MQDDFPEQIRQAWERITSDLTDRKRVERQGKSFIRGILEHVRNVEAQAGAHEADAVDLKGRLTRREQDLHDLYVPVVHERERFRKTLEQVQDMAWTEWTAYERKPETYRDIAHVIDKALNFPVDTD